MGSVTSCKIVVENEHYFAGDTVEGYVEAAIKKPVKVSSILLTLSFKEYSDMSNGEFTESIENERNLLPQQTQRLSLPDMAKKIQPGVYQIPFTVTLPENTPPTFGIVKDWSKVNVFCKLSVNLAQKSMIGMGSQSFKPLKVASLKHPRDGPISEEIDIRVKPLLGSSQGIVQVHVRLDRSAYMQGDMVKLRYSVSNQSTRKLTNISFRAVQKARLGLKSRIRRVHKKHEGEIWSRMLGLEPNGVVKDKEASFKYDPDFPNFEGQLISAKSYIEVKFGLKGGSFDKKSLTTTVEVFTYGYMEKHHGSKTEATKIPKFFQAQRVVAQDYNPNEAITLAVSVQEQDKLG